MLKHLRLPLAAWGFAAVVSGCTHVHSSQNITDSTLVEYDKYKGVTYVKGTPLGYSTLGQSDQRLITTALDAKGDVVDMWIDYSESGPDVPRLFTSASDANALPLTVETLERDRAKKGTAALEQVAIHLPPNYLRDHRIMGINVRIEGRHGDQIVTFEPPYLSGYWAKLVTTEACLATRTC